MATDTDYDALPADDEAPAVLLEEAFDYLRNALPGWEPSLVAPEVALLASVAEEGSTLYALLRIVETDRYRDFGTILGVDQGEAEPAVATTTWTANDTLGHVIDAGTSLVIETPAGRVAFEVVNEREIPPNETTLAGVLIQAVDPGSSGTGADGAVILDEPPTWLAGITLDAPATGGADEQTPAEHLDSIKRAIRLLSRAAIKAEDFELVVQELPEVDRALVLDLYDAQTGDDDVDGAVSVFPIDAAGQGSSAGVRARALALLEERSVINGITRVGTPDYNDIAVAATVVADPAVVDQGEIALLVAEVIRNGSILSPARFGQPPLGERRSWRLRRTVRHYEVAGTIGAVPGVDALDELTLNGVAENVALTGAAPLPKVTTVNVTVVNPS